MFWKMFISFTNHVVTICSSSRFQLKATNPDSQRELMLWTFMEWESSRIVKVINYFAPSDFICTTCECVKFCHAYMKLKLVFHLTSKAKKGKQNWNCAVVQRLHSLPRSAAAIGSFFKDNLGSSCFHIYNRNCTNYK